MARKPILLIVGGVVVTGVLVAALLPGGRMGLAQLFQSALSVFGVRTAEEPPYDIIARVGEVEIRRYGPRLAAETTVAGESREPMNQAFFILAKYIFGGNHQKRDIAMTAPVTMDQSQQIAMTAPVTTETGDGSAMTMRFFLPKEITPANAPTPDDPRVKLVEMPAETLAVLRFTGGWSARAREEEQRKLLAALDGAKWQPQGEPFTQLYDPPFTLPFLRRNEVAVRVGARP